MEEGPIEEDLMEEDPMEEDPMAPRIPQAPHAQCAVDSSPKTI